MDMGSYKACPYCGRKATQGETHNWFPVYTCRKCGQKYCEHDGPPCPECDSREHGKFDKVYA